MRVVIDYVNRLREVAINDVMNFEHYSDHLIVLKTANGDYYIPLHNVYCITRFKD